MATCSLVVMFLHAVWACRVFVKGCAMLSLVFVDGGSWTCSV